MVDSKRKLAAIVFTDIVGFTKLSSENEPASLALLDSQRKLLAERSYLENAFGQVMKDKLDLEPEVAEKYINYPIVKEIIKEWEMNIQLKIFYDIVFFFLFYAKNKASFIRVSSCQPPYHWGDISTAIFTALFCF